MLLAEKLLLLGLGQEKGTVVTSAQTALNFGLVGAILMKLSLMNRFRLEKDKVILQTPSETSDPILNRALLAIAKAKSPKKLQHWVTRLGKGELRTQLANRLVDRGILKKERKHFLWLFPYTTHPEANPTPEQELRNEIRHIVLENGEPTEEQLILISLIKACNLINELFAKEDRRVAKQRIEDLVKGHAVGKAVSAATAAVNAAIFAAVAASSAAAASSGGN